MSLKSIFKTILTLTAIAVIIFAADFYWKYFRGAWPAILPPIVMSPVPSFSPSSSGTVLQNTTGIPLSLPPGFSISIFAKNLTNPRVMTFDPDGNLLASFTSEGKVVALPDKNIDGVADETAIVASGLNRPHGLAFQCEAGYRTVPGEGAAGTQKCRLYIVESGQIAMYDYDRENIKASNKQKIADLPGGGNHFTRTIGFGLTGRLYVSVGSSCNACIEKDPRRASIFSMNPDGSDFKEFARGLRNTVFFTWHPVSGKMWGTDMGRDFLGDTLPPDEINILENGKNYGWPICYGKNTHDTNFDLSISLGAGKNIACNGFIPSYIDIPAHSAPLGLAFVPKDTEKGKFGAGKTWPEDYWYDLFVAYHGSWNRSMPTGYKIVRYKLDEKGNYLGADSTRSINSGQAGSPQVENFITGWLKPGDGAYGRPVDIIVLPGGYMYISDDKAGVIYRVVYRGK